MSSYTTIILRNKNGTSTVLSDMHIRLPPALKYRRGGKKYILSEYIPDTFCQYIVKYREI